MYDNEEYIIIIARILYRKSHFQFWVQWATWKWTYLGIRSLPGIETLITSVPITVQLRNLQLQGAASTMHI